MPLQRVVVAAPVAANTAFTITVPGNESWLLLSICATLSRAVGGTPNRSLRLAITDGSNTLAAAPADDAGTEPGTLTVSWADAQPAASSSGSTGTTIGPLPQLTLLPGYKIIGTVLNGSASDQWTRAAAWVNFAPT